MLLKHMKRKYLKQLYIKPGEKIIVINTKQTVTIKILYVSLIATIKQKATVGTQKTEKGIRVLTLLKMINLLMKLVREKERNTGTTKHSENNKMPLVNPYVLSF